MIDEFTYLTSYSIITRSS